MSPHAHDRDIVITGYGVCCNLGHDLTEIEAALRSGRGGPFTRWKTAVEANCRCELVGFYPGDVSDDAIGISKADGRFMGRASRLAIRASRAALAIAGLTGSRDLAVVAGTGTGDVDAVVEVRRKLDETKNARKVLPTMVPRLMASTLSANLVNVLRTKGPSFSATAACASGAYNLLLAAELVRGGHAPAALAGGAEVIDIHFHAGFDSMRAYNGGDNERPERASRPYAADRAGFIFSEGAGMLVVETRAAAAARGATVLGVLLGWGASSDGEGQMVAPSSDGAYRAIRSALAHAERAPGDIDYVNTHGTSTPVGDVGEVEAIKKALDGRHVAYSSTKGNTGHTVSAAGAIEAAFTIAMLRGGWVAPSINARPLDPALEGYPPVLEPTDRKIRTALSNSFGFGGTNVTLVLGAA